MPKTKKAAKAELTISKGELTFTKEQIELIKNTVAKGATDQELALFLHQAEKTGLDPLANQIHFNKYQSSTGKPTVSIITGIDGYRAVAERSGDFAGNDDYKFNDNRTEYDLVSAGEKHPVTATATVYRIIQGQRVPFSATAGWSAYCPTIAKKRFMWDKFPFLMLGKCAEALALRKAFPQDLSGVYTREEMGQANIDNSVADKQEFKEVEQTEEASEAELTQDEQDALEQLPSEDVMKNLNYHLRLMDAIKSASLEEIQSMKPEIKEYLKMDGLLKPRKEALERLLLEKKNEFNNPEPDEEGIGEDGTVEDAEMFFN